MMQLKGWAFTSITPGSHDPPWEKVKWPGAKWVSSDIAVRGTPECILSWNTDHRPSTQVTFDISSHFADGWSTWTRAGTWGPAACVYNDGDPRINVEIDVVTLKEPADAVRLRIRSLNGRLPAQRLVLAVTTGRQRVHVPPQTLPSEFLIPIPFHSQFEEDPAIAQRICGPTSLAMVLRSLGRKVRPAEVAAAAFDPEHVIYGNWAYLVAAASEFGTVAWIERCNSLIAVQEKLAAGYRVILSVAYDEGELDGAPVPQSSGHLLVLRGWTSEGDPIFNDPAFRDGEGEGVVYPRKQFETLWLRHGGATILVRLA